MYLHFHRFVTLSRYKNQNKFVLHSRRTFPNSISLKRIKPWLFLFVTFIEKVTFTSCLREGQQRGIEYWCRFSSYLIPSCVIHVHVKFLKINFFPVEQQVAIRKWLYRILKMMKSLTRGTIVNNSIKTSPVFIYFLFPDSLCFLYAILSILCIKKVQVCETTFTRTKPTTSCNVSIYYEYIWSSICAFWNANITFKPWIFFFLLL